MHTLTFEKIDWVNDKTLICGKNLSEGIKKHLKRCFFFNIVVHILFIFIKICTIIYYYLFIYLFIICRSKLSYLGYIRI